MMSICVYAPLPWNVVAGWSFYPSVETGFAQDT